MDETRRDLGSPRPPISRSGGRTMRAGGIIWVALLIFLGLCLLGGGSNLPSAPGLIVLRPVSILLVAAFLMAPRQSGDRAMLVPALMLAALTASILIQLIPIPPGIWWHLPGHAELSGLSAIVAADAVWRPLSLTPSLTWNSLLASLTSWVIVLAFARLPRDRDRTLVAVIILMALASCLAGLLQLIGGKASIFYFYKSDETIAGLLANRNHQATMLAMTLPLLRVWSLAAKPEARLARGAVAALLGGVMLGAIFLTGSRSGLALALVGTVAAYAMAPAGRSSGRRATAAQRARRWGLIALPALLVTVVILAGRDLSVQRLFQADYANEVRLRSLPTTLSLVGAYFPVGSGYGSFDAVFRMHEPHAILKPTFFNRAHNDYLELAITGGLLPLILLAVAIIWAGRMGWRAFRRSWQEDGVPEARAATIMLLILALASISDYPVRTPLVTAIASIAVCWLARAGAGKTPVDEKIGIGPSPR